MLFYFDLSLKEEEVEEEVGRWSRRRGSVIRVGKVE